MELVSVVPANYFIDPFDFQDKECDCSVKRKLASAKKPEGLKEFQEACLVGTGYNVASCYIADLYKQWTFDQPKAEQKKPRKARAERFVKEVVLPIVKELEAGNRDQLVQKGVHAWVLDGMLEKMNQ